MFPMLPEGYGRFTEGFAGRIFDAIHVFFVFLLLFYCCFIVFVIVIVVVVIIVIIVIVVVYSSSSSPSCSVFVALLCLLFWMF